MKFKLIIVLTLLSLIAACGHTYRVGDPRSYNEDDGDENDSLFDINRQNNLKIAGDYDITVMEFDSDPSDSVTTISTVSTVMRYVAGSTRGQTWHVQAAIKDASLTLNEDGSYNLYYKFANASSQGVKIGEFSEGRQSGDYEVFMNTISFFPGDSPDPGFAYTSVTTYTGEFDDTGSLILAADTPSMNGSYLDSVKASK